MFKFGNDYITVKGQHRMAVAKFLGLSNIEVNVQEYEFDEEGFAKYNLRKSVLSELVELGLISDDTFQRAMESERYAMIDIDGKRIDISEKALTGFLSTYNKLSVSPVYRVIDVLRDDISEYNNRIETIADIESYKPFLRKMKRRLNLS